MKLSLWCIGKTNESYLKEGIQQYCKKLPHYLPFEYIEWPDVKNREKLSIDLLKKEEEKLILSKLSTSDYLILLDEQGETMSSKGFAQYLQKKGNSINGTCVLLIGGAFGFSEALYQRANGKISLSPMTLSHQMVRLFAVEQLYRAYSILRGEKYHHD